MALSPSGVLISAQSGLLRYLFFPTAGLALLKALFFSLKSLNGTIRHLNEAPGAADASRATLKKSCCTMTF
jgi:hypothetical protein